MFIRTAAARRHRPTAARRTAAALYISLNARPFCLRAVVHYQQEEIEVESGEKVPDGPPKATLSTEQLDRIIGKAAYFLRTCDGAVGAKTIDADVYTGEITELGLECFQATLSNLYAPMLEGQVTPAPAAAATLWHAGEDVGPQVPGMRITLAFLLDFAGVQEVGQEPGGPHEGFPVLPEEVRRGPGRDGQQPSGRR